MPLMEKDLFTEYARLGFFRDLLCNNIKYEEEILEFEKEIAADFRPNIVMVAAIDNYHLQFGNKSEIQRQNLRLAVLESLKEAVENLYTLVVPMEEDLYALLFQLNNKEETREKALDIGQNLQRYIEDETGISITIGIGLPCKNIFDLHLSYKDALRACRHKFYTGTGQAIHIANTIPFITDPNIFSIEIESQFSVKILSCDKKAAFKILDDFISSITNKTPNIDPVIVKARFNEIALIIIRAGIEAGIRSEKLGILSRRFLKRIAESDTFLELENQTKELVSQIIDEISRRRKHMNTKLFEEAIEYINDNFASNITLEDVSEHVHISPYHFSHEFKRFTSMNFIEYLTKVRINEAKKLLLTTDLSIKEVSSQVGYQDSSYFGRVFKNVEGVPPSKFKIDNQVYKEEKIKSSGK